MVLRSHMGMLLDVFTDPRIVKVFHGCQNDVLWLQRDFGLFIVNCFDTYQAAKLLNYPALSLAHLLKYYCGITVNKKHQLADWRLRPLTEELLKYAREDTHYLLYIYDCLRRDILQNQSKIGLSAVFDASRKTCMISYQKDIFSPTGYLQLFEDRRKSKKRLKDINSSQDSILRGLWDWRDQFARDLDESTGYIMSNAELIRIGTIAKTPQNAEEIRIAAQPLSTFVSDNLDEIFKVITNSVLGTYKSSSKDLEEKKSNLDSNVGSAKRQNRQSVATKAIRGPSSGVMSRLQDKSGVKIFTPSISPTKLKSYADTDSKLFSKKAAVVPPMINSKLSTITRGSPSPSNSTFGSVSHSVEDVLKAVGWVSNFKKSQGSSSVPIVSSFVSISTLSSLFL